jgi:hypothetical protein
MLRAVNLDHQASLRAKEIHYVGTNRDLSAELVAAQLPSPQATPEQSLGVSKIPTKFSGEGGLRG